MMYFAFVEIRTLGWSGKAKQAADLADAFHNLPNDLWKESLTLEEFRDVYLKTYQEKHPDSLMRNFVSMADEVIRMGADPSTN